MNLKKKPENGLLKYKTLNKLKFRFNFEIKMKLNEKKASLNIFVERYENISIRRVFTRGG